MQSQKGDETVHREYDFTIITRGDLSEADHQKTLAGYEALMAKDGGQILRKEEWGNKKLNYPIKRAYRGFYANYDFVGTTENLHEMERLMRIDDNVLRYLAVRVDTKNKTGKIDVEARKQEIAKAEAAAREAEAKKQQQR